MNIYLVNSSLEAESENEKLYFILEEKKKLEELKAKSTEKEAEPEAKAA